MNKSAFRPYPLFAALFCFFMPASAREPAAIIGPVQTEAHPESVSFDPPDARASMAEPDGMILQKIRYGIILNRLPFGPNPPTLAQGNSTSLSPAEIAALDEARKKGQNLRIRLTSISRYRGVPAAGLMDLETGRTLLLRAGERIGPFHVLEVSPEAGGALLEDGTNTYFIAISYGRNQASNLVHSAHAKHLSVFRPASVSSAFLPSVQPDAAETSTPATQRQSAPDPLSIAREKAAREQEEALFLKQATIRNADGTERISYVTLNRLRAEAARKRAEEVRAAAEALAKEQAEQARAEAAAREEEARRAEAEENKERRTEILEAIRQGLDIQDEIELTEEEADELEQSGFTIPSDRSDER